jgi:hypothetical protein
VFGGVWVWKSGWRGADHDPNRTWRALTFAALFAAVTLGPVLPIVSERTAFLASVAVAWALGIVAVGARDAALRGAPRRRGQIAGQRRGDEDNRRPARTGALPVVVLGAVAVLASAHLLALAHRAAQWQAARDVSRTVMTQLETEVPALSPRSEVWVVDLPDHIGFAWAFRNAFHPDRAAASEVLGLGRRVRAVLDTDAARPSGRAELGLRDIDVLYRFDGQALVRVIPER